MKKKGLIIFFCFHVCIFLLSMTIQISSSETFREAVPTHFLFKIQAFSQLSKNLIDKYETNAFEAGGYKWKLVLYPERNKNEDGGGDGHISMYLELVDTSSSLPACWELNVGFKLFLFDQIRDRYLIREEGRTRRFHEMKKVWCFPQFVSLAKFNDPSNGYLVEDTCMFGAEIFIAKPHENIECLSMVKQPTTVTHTWNIENFSKMEEAVNKLNFEKFKAGNQNWNILVYPKGHSFGKNNSVSIFLILADCDENPGLKVYADFKLRLRDQIHGKHIEFYEEKHWFSASSKSWGWKKFIGMVQMEVMNVDKGNGYLVKDTCIVEADVKVLGIVTKL